MDCRKQEDDIYDDETPWNIIDLYFNKQYLERLVRHQIESYNYFIDTQMINTIEMFNPVHICSEHDYIKSHNLYRLEIFIKFENFNIHRPQIYENNGATKLMFPQEARLRNFTYAANMTITMNIKYTIRTGENLNDIHTIYKTLPNIHIGKLPIMLRSNVCVLTHYKHVPNEISGECKMDPGGYFIINGSEKTCIGQERAAENQIYCYNIEKNNLKKKIKNFQEFAFAEKKELNLSFQLQNLRLLKTESEKIEITFKKPSFFWGLKFLYEINLSILLNKSTFEFFYNLWER